ncbi:MAG: hypothetical protein AB1782_11200 [Cyanobacteriota bacterium]
MFDDFDNNKKNHLPSEIVNAGIIDNENQMIIADEGKIEIIINKDSKIVNITRDVVIPIHGSKRYMALNYYMVFLPTAQAKIPLLYNLESIDYF